LKFLVLHGDTTRPQLESTGKIAGSARIDVSPVPVATEQKTFFARTVSGNLAIQLMRVLVYMFGGLFVFAGIAVSLSGLIEFIVRKSRNRHVKNFARSLAAKPTKAQLYHKCPGISS
jgi:hypothetical protein